MLSILKKYSILYVDDDPKIQANVSEFLSKYFKSVYLASDDQQALDLYKKYRPDALIIDAKLPSIDGLSVVQDVRIYDSVIKMIMLSAFYEKEKRLKAIELKFTKCHIKPTAREILEQLAVELNGHSACFLKINDNLIWDIEKQQLNFEGRQVDLSEKEHRLLELFINQKGKAVRYERIVSTIWGDAFDREISIDSIKNKVSRLRKKIPDICISNIYGEGYILR